ncbi:MAG: response regulator, partial [Planctomycetes bacterium]|nr:response regulator [Planctomycetota bacterium]
VEQELSPFLVGAAPVVFTAGYGGVWPGLFCVAVVGLLTNTYFVIPEYNAALKGNVGFVRLTMFLLEGVLISVLAGVMHDARRQAQRQRENAERAFRESQRHVEDLTHTKDALLEAQTGLRRAIAEAQNANRAKSDFLANVSHELRTPLNAVIGMTDLCLQEEVSDDVRENLTIARESASMLLRLLNDLLDFSKIEAGRFELETTQFELRESLAEVMKSLSLRAHEKGLELAMHVHPEAPDRLVGDATRLEQVVANLVNNAIKFTEQGEVVVSAEMHSLTSRKVCLLFCVADTGIGIAMEDQQRIFAPFTQADSSTTRSFEGIGLGLAIASQLISAMDGRIWLESRQGEGSKFFFTAWFELAGAEQSALPEDLDLSPLRGTPVLIVDDNSANRRILRDMLRHWEMQPVLAANAEQALARLRQGEHGRRFPLVLLDALMPGMDGFDLAGRIQSDPQLSTSTVLMISSADRQEFSHRCENLDVTYLEKPIAPRKLAESLLEAFSGIRAEREVEPPPAAADRPAVPLTVLIVEDTPANQKVMAKILEKRGHRVFAADNGREAVEMCYRHAFDVVIMDVQMPTMDGFQATAAIRDLEPSASQDRTSPDVPVVAMTAHATRGFEERCLAAGMDAYLSKPVDAAAMLSLVESYAPGIARPRRPRISGEASVTGAEAAESEPIEQMDLDAALERMDGNYELLADMAGFFLEDAPELLDRIRDGIAGYAPEEVQRAAHSLKGLAANFNAQRTIETAKEIEYAAEAGDLPAAASRLPELERLVESLAQSLKSLHV